MDEYLESLGYSKAQSNSADISVINRLVDPVSEHALNKWFPQSGLVRKVRICQTNYLDVLFYERIGEIYLLSRYGIYT